MQEEISKLMGVHVLEGKIALQPFHFSVEGDLSMDKNSALKHSIFGTKPGQWQVCCKTWISSQSCNNWFAHEHPLMGKYWIGEWMPASLFLGKKEGDLVEISYSDSITLRLTLSQSDHRYGPKPFDTIFADLVKGRKGVASHDGGYFSHPLKVSEQHAILENFEDVFNSINKA
jgi:hypothetical protein